ncbi:MAG: ribosome maturation factor RimP [Peptococcaceae bacterium]|nr:ribosome maturation factor RimP [Peptococcaceae bacterium]
MSKKRTVEIVEELIKPCVLESGMELVDVEFVKEGTDWFLRVFIDQPGGIGVEDCGYLSRKIDRLLDERDPIPQSYHLEVSSPGLERPLKKLADFGRFAGHMAVVATFAPQEGKRKISGRIVAVRDGNIILDLEGKEITIDYNQVASARLKAEF